MNSNENNNKENEVIQQKKKDMIDDTIRNMNPGDKIQFPRKCNWYQHYGICVCSADEKGVVHLSPGEGVRGLKYYLGFIFSRRYLVQRNDLMTVAQGDVPQVFNNLDDIYSPMKDSGDRAEKRIGETGYSLWFKNCEHFANMCRYNKWISEQVLTAALVILVLSFTAFSIFKYMEWLPEYYNLFNLIIALVLSLVALNFRTKILYLHRFLSRLGYFWKFSAAMAIVLLIAFLLFMVFQMNEEKEL
ncbi:Phospholipase A and acyltransferase 1 [Bulinus truncatus]|nr:Phospholipase A and acyltransferase 1 [Bulinus truncatus]